MPRLVYLLPLSALVIAALSLSLAPAGEVVFARLIGGPTDQPGVFRGRVQLVEEQRGVIEPIADGSLVLRGTQGGRVVEQSLRTSAEGWAEFEVKKFSEETMALHVFDERGRVLVQGTPSLPVLRWQQSARRRRTESPVHRSGALQVCVDVPQVVLAVPFASTIEIEAWTSEERGRCGAQSNRAQENLRIALEASGARVLGSTTCRTNARGHCAFELRPIHHQVDLAVTAHIEDSMGQGAPSAGTTMRFEQSLLVVPGAFGLSKSTHGEMVELEISSPVPRDHVWYSIVGEDRRGPGGRLSLLEQPDGTARGIVRLPVRELEGSFIVLSSDADGRSPSAVGYPLDGQRHTFDVWDGYLLDGGPYARRSLERRAWRVRYALAAYALGSILGAVVLFWVQVRKEQSALDRKLQEHGLVDRALRDTTPLVLAVLCVFFAFSATLVWIVAR